MTHHDISAGSIVVVHNIALQRRRCGRLRQLVLGQSMRRRDVIPLIGSVIAWPLAAHSQQQPGKLPYIGVLVSASPPHPFADAFWRGLHALGYSEGRNIRVEFRYTDLRSDRAEEFAEDERARRIGALRTGVADDPNRP